MQDLKGSTMKKIEQLQKNNSQTQKSHIHQPFIIERQQYHELSLYQRKGHWSQKEKLKYILFLEHFKQRFQVKAKRRFNNIFDFMAVFIKTRNPHQCRSHHQKMEKQKFAIDRIINSVRSKCSAQFYDSMKQKYWQELNCIEIDKNEDFEEFRQRIQKQEQKKENQRQKIAQNKRVLRSAIQKTSNAQRKAIKRNKHKNKLTSSRETHLKKISQNNIRQDEERFLKIQQVQNQHFSLQHENEQNNVDQQMLNDAQLAFTYDPNLIPAQVMLQHYCFMSSNYALYYDLETKQKQFMELAFIHYNQYLANADNTNNIYPEILRNYQCGMESNFQY